MPILEWYTEENRKRSEEIYISLYGNTEHDKDSNEENDKKNPK